VIIGNFLLHDIFFRRGGEFSFFVVRFINLFLST
jgi:hypothetical protein